MMTLATKSSKRTELLLPTKVALIIEKSGAKPRASKLKLAIGRVILVAAAPARNGGES